MLLNGFSVILVTSEDSLHCLYLSFQCYLFYDYVQKSLYTKVQVYNI